MPGLDRIDVATQTKRIESGSLRDLPGDLYDDYDHALADSPSNVVYVSLVNSHHREWAEAAIASGKHVVVDKPAFLGIAEADRVVKLARRHRVCLAEATVYGYHPQVALAKEVFHEEGSRPLRITVTFSVPPLDPENFRYRRSLGGGALWDLGPYAVSVGRVFFEEPARDFQAHVTSRGGVDDVETGFSMLASYPGGRSVVGHFGFDTVYRNRVDILGHTAGVELDRIFTTPPDTRNTLRVTREADSTTVEAPPADSFRVFFQHVFERIAADSWDSLTDDLLADARALQELRDAALRE
jgi:predicted dehydrogenase